MTPAERRATAGMASIYGLRMLGMFIRAAGAGTSMPRRCRAAAITRWWAWALGAYGLTQAILQVPFGWASDRWGRKPVIASGSSSSASAASSPRGRRTSGGRSPAARCRAPAPSPPPRSR